MLPPGEESNHSWHWQPLRELAGGGLLAMELLLATFWFTTFARGYKPLAITQALAVLGVVFAGAYLLERTSQAWPVSNHWRRAILGAAFLFGLWVALEGLVYFPDLPNPTAILSRIYRDFASEYIIPLEFWALIVALLVWGRGLALAHTPVDTDRISSSLLLGLLSLLIYQILPVNGEDRLAFWFVFLFAFLGLLSMGAARIATLIELRGGKQTLASRGWLVGLSISAVLVAGLSVLLSIILRGPIGQVVIHIFALILGLFSALMMLLLYPVALAIAYLIIYLQDRMLQTLLDSPLMNMLHQLQQIIDKLVNDNTPKLLAITRAIKPITMWTILIAITLGVALAIGLRVYREIKHRMDNKTTQISAAEVLQEVGKAARKRASELADELARRLRHTSAARWFRAARIRWVYTELMALCTRLKHPRHGAVTPLEFLPEMTILFPDHAADLDTITQAYLRVRYGEKPETSQEVKSVVEAWEKIKTSGK
jgi:hypothetical protein